MSKHTQRIFMSVDVEAMNEQQLSELVEAFRRRLAATYGVERPRVAAAYDPAGTRDAARYFLAAASVGMEDDLDTGDEPNAEPAALILAELERES